MNIYIHVPFCRAKCGYCVFYSSCDLSLIDRYLDRLEGQLKAQRRVAVGTLYVGGGTPTVLGSAQLARLTGMLTRYLDLGQCREISIEANPETLDADKVKLLQTFATRVSLGVQSFDPATRKILGRDCSQQALTKSLSLIAAAKFGHVNLDLIYAVPGQSLQDWAGELAAACEWPVDHLSCYSLTPEEGALLTSGWTVDEDLSLSMWELAGMELKKRGLARYEISNYAKPGGRCQHNLNVWHGGKLLGLGPAAASFDGVDRYTQVDSLAKWLAGAPPEFDRIPRSQRLDEIFAVNLRTVDGWQKSEWEAFAGANDWFTRRQALRQLPPELYEIGETSIRLTSEGLLLWNEIAEKMITL